MNRHTGEDGFSLLELVVAVGIILVIVGGIVAWGPLQAKARTAALNKAASEVFTGAVANDIDPDDATTVEGAAKEWNDTRSRKNITTTATKDGECIRVTAVDTYGKTVERKAKECDESNGGSGSDDDGSGSDDNGNGGNNGDSDTETGGTVEPVIGCKWDIAEAEKQAELIHADVLPKFKTTIQSGSVEYYGNQIVSTQNILGQSGNNYMAGDSNCSTHVDFYRVVSTKGLSYAFSKNKSYYAYYYTIDVTSKDKDGSAEKSVRVYGLVNVADNYVNSVKTYPEGSSAKENVYKGNFSM